MVPDYSFMKNKLKDISDILNHIEKKNFTDWDSLVQGDASMFFGWIDVPVPFRTRIHELDSVLAQINKHYYSNIVLIGFGGSILGARAIIETMGLKSEVTVRFVDTNHPNVLMNVLQDDFKSNSLYIFCSKSGTTMETWAVYRYFLQEIKKLSSDENVREKFIAITDSGSPLELEFLRNGFPNIIVGEKNVGGRFSAITPFGLFPAMLAGIDVTEIITSYELMSLNNKLGLISNHPSYKLTEFLVKALIDGRDKLRLVICEEFKYLTGWIEQLIAESLGKNSLGIIPYVVDETVFSKGQDKAIYVLKYGNANSSSYINQNGIPVYETYVKNLPSIGGEMYKWQVSVATLGVMLSVNPFDQPSVERSKYETSLVLSTYPNVEPFMFNSINEFKNMVCQIEQGNYIAVLSFLDPTEEHLSLLSVLQHNLYIQTGIPTIIGIGPNYLHSIGQLHKDGADSGVFLHLVSGEHYKDVQVPGENYGFGYLMKSQAYGDFLTLQSLGKTTVILDLGVDESKGLLGLIEILK
jgi:glucose-6-phosphate isomerase